MTALSSGAPIDGATVTVLTPQGKQVFVGMTTADGILTIPGSATLKPQTAAAGRGGEDDWANYRSQRLIAIVEKANDLAIVDGNWSNGIQLWNFGVTEDRRGGATRIRGFIQSDRGLYRPGETVFFKGIAREVGLHSPPRVPAGKAAEIEIEDSRGQTVLTTRSKLSSFGGFAFELPLGADATVGDYYVRAKLGGQVFREKFSVEEFRPATFEIKLASATASPKPGERLTFELGAKYLFGAPASEAKVEWSLRKRAHRVAFKGFDQYTFSANPRDWWWDESADDYGEFLADGTGETDAQGHLAIEARDGATSFAGPVDYILSANVTDEADQTMGKSALVTAHKTGFYLGMHANEFVQAVGMPFGVNLVALAHEGARVATRAKLSFIRTVATCSWNDVGSRSFERCDSAEKVMFVRDVSIANAGSHVERIYPTEPGNYIVKAEAKDAAGNPVIVASEIWVIGKGEAFWSGDEGDRMTLVASKPVYQPGDKARLVAQTNLVKPTALITVERDGIIEARVQKLASASEGIELAIADAWAPNVYASVALVSGRRGVGDKHRPLFK
ncbi:MAG: MG2 domain-containing protein, partial [Kofleriaceae bacterium]